jgi:sugar O-acyltransferase (sialic acid O-acetyltransferase NeuD family)
MIPPADFIIWGSAGHAMVLADIIAGDGRKILAFFDRNPNTAPAVAGVPLFAGEQDFHDWLYAHGPGRLPAAAVAIGGPRGADRLAILRMLARAGLETPHLVHTHSSVSPAAEIGAGSHVLAMSVVAAGVRAGEGVIVNHGAVVDHECVLGDGCHIAPGAVLCGCVTLGDNTFIGAGATILPRITIGANTIIGAGSVVTRDIPPGSIAYGSPATIRNTTS